MELGEKQEQNISQCEESGFIYIYNVCSVCVCVYIYIYRYRYTCIYIYKHYFANKDPSSQGYGFSSGHVWMLELDCEES